jgi:UDP-2,3-diacylglucosamine hydrolase
MIGLIFGDTDFPNEILKRIKKKKINYLIIDLSKSKKFKKDKKSYSVSIGQFGKIINILRKNRCKKVLFAGKVHKPNFSKLKLDFKGIYYIPRIIKASKLGDTAILREIIKILVKEKIKVISSITFNPELALSKGSHTKLKPDKNDLTSINKGIKSLGELNPHNHVQGLVVKNSNIIAKETSKGTKKMLQLIKKSKNSLSILIKFPKTKQDLRVDLPTIGLGTLKDCKRSRVKGIVLKSKQNIFMDKNKSINFANKNKIFIIVK